MQRSDWFAWLVGLLLLGAGAVLSTYPAEIIQIIGWSIMVAAIGGLIVWFAIERGSRRLNTWGPWVLIIGGPIIGLLWFYLNFTGTRIDVGKGNSEQHSNPPPANVVSNPVGSNIAIGPISGSITQNIKTEPEPLPQRKLTAEQESAILEAISAAPPATLFIPWHNSGESHKFSRQFERLFESKGWKFLHFDSAETLRPKSTNQIMIGWRNKKTKSYEAVRTALKAAHIVFIESEAEISGDQNVDLIVFDVGVVDANDVQAAMDRIR